MSIIGWQPGNRGRKKTRFHYAPKAKQKQRYLLLFAALFCGVMLVVALSQLIGYVGDLASSRRRTEELRDVYYAAQEMQTPAPTQWAATPAPEITPVPTAKPPILTALHYPGNPGAKVQERFAALQTKNKDILGWLSIGTHLDEPVVQRDNEYYLRRDYLGNKNNNGTLFLDQSITWQTRPYTLMIYGHNMKSGAMFGHLKSYEKYDYLLDYGIITFDTAYENGRYVVFAVGTYSMNGTGNHPLNLSRLDSRTVSVREKEIARLIKGAVTKAPVDVQADDQLLLLITCVDDENDRRVLAARRVRENENEADLLGRMALARPDY